MTWLHAPMYLLLELGKQLPRLEAAESLRRATEIAVGTGSVKPDELKRVWGEWERSADGEPTANGQRRAEQRGRTWMDNLKALDLMGIPVTITKAPKAASGG